MVNRRLITFLESRGSLDNRQFSIRPDKSTDDYLTELEDIIDSHLESVTLFPCICSKHMTVRGVFSFSSPWKNGE